MSKIKNLKIQILEKKIKILDREIKLTSALVFLFIIIFFVAGYIEESRISDLKENQKLFSSVNTNNKDFVSDNYRKQAKDILSHYFSKKSSLIINGIKAGNLSSDESASWLNLVREVKNKLLELITPAEYKNIHLNLVLSFNYIEQGIFSKDGDKIKAGEDGINSLVKKYPWLIE